MALESSQFELYERADEDFGFRLKAKNGEQVASGEGYTTRSDASRGTRTLTKCAIEAAEADGVLEDILAELDLFLVNYGRSRVVNGSES